MVKTSGGEKRPALGNAVVDRILRSAQSHFARFGYEGARVDEIAREAGINKATLYYQVGDKGALYHAVLGPLFATAAADLQRKVDREPTPESRLRAYVGGLAHLLVQERDLAPLLLREAVAGGEHLSDELVQSLARINRTLRDVLAEGVESGAFRAMDTLTLQSLIVGGLLFHAGAAPLRARAATLGSHVALRAGSIPAHRLVATVMDLILGGIANRFGGTETYGADEFEPTLPA
jgi:AcrR family transcriptional regulator